jgi:hypothetical protein
MFRKLARFFANVLLFSASSLFIAAFAAIGFASFMLTCPLVWGRPTRRRVKAGVELMVAVLGFMATLKSPTSMKEMMAMARQVAVGEELEDEVEGIHLTAVTPDDA